MLLHNAARLRVPVDSWRLFVDPDGSYASWVALVTEQVHATVQEEQAKAEAQNR